MESSPDVSLSLGFPESYPSPGNDKVLVWLPKPCQVLAKSSQVVIFQFSPPLP